MDARFELLLHELEKVENWLTATYPDLEPNQFNQFQYIDGKMSVRRVSDSELYLDHASPHPRKT
jgi:hypothetical protein